MAFDSSAINFWARIGRALSKRKDNLFLNSILTRRESVEWHEEVREVAAVAQLTLNVDQALQTDLLGESIVEPEMIGANVDAAVRSQIVVGDLRNHRVRALRRKDVQ